MKAPIRLYWWRHQDPAIRNAGDELSPLIVAAVSGRAVEWAPPETCDLAAAGSIAEIALRARRQGPVRLWGTGFLRAGPAWEGAQVRASAVRGPGSAARLGLVPESSGGTHRGVVLGDPGLLAGRLLEGPVRRCHAIGVVPHYVDLEEPMVRAWRASAHRVISPLLEPRAYVRAIAECESILSSSLHGLIVADALGIPNRWVRLSDRVLGDGFKFRDHFGSLGRTDPGPAHLPAPEDVTPTFLAAIADAHRPLPAVAHVARELEAAFPPDL